MSDSASKTLTDIEQAFKTIVWDPMIKAGETWLEGLNPFLNLPVIKNLDELIIGQITGAIFSQIVIFIDVSYIRMVNPILQSKWASAAESLSIIAQEQGVNSDAYKKALADAAIDFAKWVHTGPQ